MADSNGQILRGLESLPAAARGGVATVGNFDGVHLGHQRILQVACCQAASAGTRVLAVTFDPSPEAVLSPTQPAESILPNPVKYRRLLDLGADLVLVMETTRRFLEIAPEAFVGELVDRLAPVCLVEGPDFRFGRHRAGDIQTLRRLARQGGFEVVEVEAVQLDLPGLGQVRVSSSLLRQLIRSGDVDGAACCLGRPYVLHGRVVAGERRGRRLEFPTANIEAPGRVAPGDGIYAAWAEVGERRYAAAVSVGHKPTFGPGRRTIEAHLLDAAGDFYDLPIALAFLRRLRDQQKFPDAAGLRAQIAKDIQRVRQICR